VAGREANKINIGKISWTIPSHIENCMTKLQQYLNEGREREDCRCAIASYGMRTHKGPFSAGKSRYRDEGGTEHPSFP